MLDEMINGTPTPVEYRIVAVEPDGSIKVMRNEVLKNGTNNLTKPFDSRTSEITGPRLNSDNPYCMQYNNGNWIYSGGTYYGCNAWGKMSGTINDVNSTKVSTDSEMKTYLNTTFYNILAESTKKIIISHTFNLVNADYDSSTGIGTKDVSELYTDGLTANKWEGKIGLIELRDWFIASGSTDCKNGNGYYTTSIASENQTSANHATNYKCSASNYMYIDANWWTITPYRGRNRIFTACGSGSVDNYFTCISHAIRPVFFLSPNTQLTGNGTKGANAYKIKS